jgi:hypothetical protein
LGWNNIIPAQLNWRIDMLNNLNNLNHHIKQLLVVFNPIEMSVVQQYVLVNIEAVFDVIANTTAILIEEEGMTPKDALTETFKYEFDWKDINQNRFNMCAFRLEKMVAMLLEDPQQELSK